MIWWGIDSFIISMRMTVLFSPYSAGLQQMLRACAQYGMQYIKLNPKRTVVKIARNKEECFLFLSVWARTRCHQGQKPSILFKPPSVIMMTCNANAVSCQVNMLALRRWRLLSLEPTEWHIQPTSGAVTAKTRWVRWKLLIMMPFESYCGKYQALSFLFNQ